MREQLLGYLMGALDEAEQAEVRAAIESDARLAAECARLEQAIAPLAEDDAWLDPPSRLAERTIAHVEAQPPAVGRRFNWKAVEESPQLVQPASLSQAVDAHTSQPRRWTLADAIVAAGICAAAAILLFPAIASSRQQAAVLHCQNNLRQIGHALVDFSRHNQGNFPLVAATGNMGVAGSYAPLLKEAGLIEQDSTFVCPSSALANDSGDFRIPDQAELMELDGKPLQLAQRKLGGSYGYAFGHLDENNQYRANVNRSRPRFAILSDAPSLHLEHRRSANHGGGGQNVLFEDNHVEYLKRCCASEELGDNVFLSDRGLVEAGRHYNDAVIGDSSSRPIVSRDSFAAP